MVGANTSGVGAISVTANVLVGGTVSVGVGVSVGGNNGVRLNTAFAAAVPAAKVPSKSKVGDGSVVGTTTTAVPSAPTGVAGKAAPTGWKQPDRVSAKKMNAAPDPIVDGNRRIKSLLKFSRRRQVGFKPH